MISQVERENEILDCLDSQSWCSIEEIYLTILERRLAQEDVIPFKSVNPKVLKKDLKRLRRRNEAEAASATVVVRWFLFIPIPALFNPSWRLTKKGETLKIKRNEEKYQQEILIKPLGA